MTPPLHANDGADPESWYAMTSKPPGPYPTLEGPAQADVAIVGGGYAGLTAALHLARSGLDVALLEAHRVGFGASGRNGGQVGSGYNRDMAWLERTVGRPEAARLWRMAEDAKALVRDLVVTHAPEADWRPGIAYAGRRSGDMRALHAAGRHLRDAYGYDRVALLGADEMRDRLGSGAVTGGLLDTGAAHLHPLRYVYGLARAAEAARARLHEGTEILAVDPGPPVRLHHARGTLTAEHAIVAAGGYLGALLPSVTARAQPLNGFVAATEPLGAAGEGILKGGIAAADSRFVISYWRMAEGRLIFGGGESHRRRFPRDMAARVRRPLAELYPALAKVPFSQVWGGTLSITRSRLPLFARPAPGIVSIGGFSGQGIALATLAGRLAAEAVTDRAAGFDRLAGLPTPRFPAGSTLRTPLFWLALQWFGARDRLGF